MLFRSAPLPRNTRRHEELGRYSPGLTVRVSHSVRLRTHRCRRRTVRLFRGHRQGRRRKTNKYAKRQPTRPFVNPPEKSRGIADVDVIQMGVVHDCGAFCVAANHAHDVAPVVNAGRFIAQRLQFKVMSGKSMVINMTTISTNRNGIFCFTIFSSVSPTGAA